MGFKSLHFQSVACPRMRTLVLQTMDFQSIVVDCGEKQFPCYRYFGTAVLARFAPAYFYRLNRRGPWAEPPPLRR